MTAKNRTKDVLYLIFTIIIPASLLIYLSYYISKGITFIVYEVFAIKIDFTFLNTISEPVLFLIAFFVLRFLIKNKILTKIVFTKGVIGKYPIYIYRFAEIIGYSKIDMKYKPIPLQFKILNKCDFDINYDYILIDNTDKALYKSSIINQNSEINEVNLLLSDTYNHGKEVIPCNKRNLYTIIIERTNFPMGGRIYNDKLIELIQNEINKIKNSKKTINLFLYTNPLVINKIYSNVFHTKNDYYKLRIFYSTDNDFAFSNEYEEIEC